MTDVLIPAQAAGTICGTFLCGQRLVGQVIGGDTYADFPLALDGGSGEVKTGVTLTGNDFPLELEQGTAEVLFTRVHDDFVLVEITGSLDLPVGSAEVSTGVTLTAADFPLQLPTETAEVTTSRRFIVQTVDFPLELGGGVPKLLVDVRLILLPGDSPPLALDGGPVHVNPALMPELCVDLALPAVACTPLDLIGVTPAALALVPATAGQLDLIGVTPVGDDMDPADCLEA